MSSRATRRACRRSPQPCWTVARSAEADPPTLTGPGDGATRRRPDRAGTVGLESAEPENRKVVPDDRSSHRPELLCEPLVSALIIRNLGADATAGDVLHR